MNMKRLLFCIYAILHVVLSHAATTSHPMVRDSIVVDSITGDVRKYKLTDNKTLQPLYWVYNYLANSNKLRTYTSARYYTDAEILKTITGGKS